MIYRSVMKLTQWASCGLVSFSYVVEQPFASSDMERICMYFGYFAVNASFNVVVMVHCFLSLLSLSFFQFVRKVNVAFLRKHYYYCGDNDNNCAIIVGRHSVLFVARMKSTIIQSKHPIGIIFKFKVRLTSVLIITNIVVRAVSYI